MKKPHEQEWKQEDGVYVVNRETNTPIAITDATDRDDARDAAAFIAAAPDMARALLAELDPDGHTEHCGSGLSGYESCTIRCARIRSTLRKAGVL